MMRVLRGCIGDRDGAAAVEFGLVLPFLVALIYGVIELGRLFWAVGVLNFAVEQAARCAVVNSATTCASSAATKSYAAGYAGLAVGFGITAANFTVGACSNGISGTQVSTSSDNPVTFTSALVQLLGGRGSFGSITLNAQSCYPT